MVAVLLVYDHHACVAMCDDRCHKAKGPATGCECICGGVNHGVGRQQAIENTRKGVGLSREELEHFARAHNLEAATLTVYDALKTPAHQIRRERALEARRLKRAAWERMRQAEAEAAMRRLVDWTRSDPFDR